MKKLTKLNIPEASFEHSPEYAAYTVNGLSDIISDASSVVQQVTTSTWSNNQSITPGNYTPIPNKYQSENKELKAKIEELEEKLASYNGKCNNVESIKDAFNKAKREADANLAALLTVLEGYLDEDITDEDDIISKLLERVAEIKKTPMCVEMRQRILAYREEHHE